MNFTNNNKSSIIISEILFILLIVVGIVYLAAIFTHSPNENPWSGGTIITEPTNQAGIIGAWIADISLSIFGYSSYIIPIALIWLGIEVHKNIKQKRSSIYISIIRLIAFINLIAFSCALFTQSITNYQSPAGGWIGQMMHNYFSTLFGSTAIIVYLSAIMICFSVASTASWTNIFIRISSLFHTIFNKLSAINFKINKKTAKPKNINTSTIRSDTAKKIKTNKDKVKNTLPPSHNFFNVKSVNNLPSLNLLNSHNKNVSGYSQQELADISLQVKLKLKDFGFDIEVTAVNPGPVVTQFELSLAPGIKVSKIINLNKDLARALLVESVRIVDVIPGRPVIGLEIPNAERAIISLKEIFSSKEFNESNSVLSMGLGKYINGLPVVVDLAKMPHLLVAGATGMGKSVGINAMILSILYKASPEQVRMIMIDPKIVELACYKDIPHLLTPVITDMNKAANALWWCVSEMERRYLLLAKLSVRNIDGFNEKLVKEKERGKPILDPLFDTNNTEQETPELKELPLIVLIIDEYADMLGALAQEDRTKSKRVEALIIRIAQKARAAGIHLIIATQRPSVDVITGLIKSNIPTRIAFKVSSKIDARTVLDQGGAEQLLGKGDMLYMTPGVLSLTRIHGAFVNDNEVLRVVKFLKNNSKSNYINDIVNNTKERNQDQQIEHNNGELDELYDEAVKIVTTTGRASISSIQRRMRIGYNRAARIIEDMEANGVVSTMNSAGNREVLAPKPV